MLHLQIQYLSLKRKLSGFFNITQALFVFVIVVSTYSCIKDQTPVLTVSALMAEIEYGATTRITWASENITMVSVDGVKLSGVNGSFETEPLTKTTTFNFTGTGPEGSVNTSITVMVKKLVVEAYVYATPSGVVKYNNPVTSVFWTTKNVATATVNNTSIPVNDSIKFEYLTKDTTLSFIFTGTNGEKIEKSVLLDVSAPTKIDLMVDLICGSWNATKRETEVSPGVWKDTGLAENYKSFIRTFYKNGTYDIYDPVKKVYVLAGTGANWHFVNENKLFYGGATTDIVSLNEKELVFGNNFEVWSTELNQVVAGSRYHTTFTRTK